MDIFLTTGAFRTLTAAGRLASAGGCRGFLLGHRRGDRVYIESALPSPRSAWPSLESFYALDADLERKIVGFFIWKPSAAARMPLLQPFGTGKVLVELSGPAGKKPVLSGAVVDYEGRFIFRRIPVIVERPAP
ncbi:MAG: hypothetical protein JW843_00165 [Candidatus Aminicenantes bacterium]|nr:hypothetical protein [Candidatus Aminicenantes bacterium]